MVSIAARESWLHCVIDSVAVRDVYADYRGSDRFDIPRAQWYAGESPYLVIKESPMRQLTFAMWCACLISATTISTATGATFPLERDDPDPPGPDAGEKQYAWYNGEVSIFGWTCEDWMSNTDLDECDATLNDQINVGCNGRSGTCSLASNALVPTPWGGSCSVAEATSGVEVLESLTLTSSGSQPSIYEGQAVGDAYGRFLILPIPNNPADEGILYGYFDLVLTPNTTGDGELGGAFYMEAGLSWLEGIYYPTGWHIEGELHNDGTVDEVDDDVGTSVNTLYTAEQAVLVPSHAEVEAWLMLAGGAWENTGTHSSQWLGLIVAWFEVEE